MRPHRHQYRCVKCLDLFIEISGDPEQVSSKPWYCSQKFCDSCSTLVEQALHPVGKKFSLFWALTSDVTVEELTREGEPGTRKICANLIDTLLPENKHVVEEVKCRGATYNFEYWTLQGGSEKARVYIQAAKSLETGEIVGPWSPEDRWESFPKILKEPEPWPERPPSTHKFVLCPMKAPSGALFYHEYFLKDSEK